jgi:hypothetical protein
MITPYVCGRTNRQAFAAPVGHAAARSAVVDLLVKDAGPLVAAGVPKITDRPSATANGRVTTAADTGTGEVRPGGGSTAVR